jgi:hypothetical protein
VSRKQEQRFGEYTSTCISTGIAMTEKETTNSVSIEPRSTASVEANEALRETPTVGKADSKDSKTKRKRKRRRKRVRIGDALRCEGLDEREVAQKLRSVIEKETPDTTDKMRAEILMNCFRYLDDAPGPRPGAKQCGKLPAKLVHEIPRPQRAAKPKDVKQKGTGR